MDMSEAVTVIKSTNQTVDMWTYVADNNLELFRLAGVAEQKLRKIGNAMEVPENIPVQNENMATSLAVLSMHLQAQIKEKK